MIDQSLNSLAHKLLTVNCWYTDVHIYTMVKYMKQTVSHRQLMISSSLVPRPETVFPLSGLGTRLDLQPQYLHISPLSVPLHEGFLANLQEDERRKTILLG